MWYNNSCMEQTITAKLLLAVSEEEYILLEMLSEAYREACNHVSGIAFHTGEYNAINLQKLSYSYLRTALGLKAQMAISVTRTVAGKYVKAKRSKLSKPVQFSLPQCDQVPGRDWSINMEKGIVSLNTLENRIKVPFSARGYEKYMTKDACFGGARIVLRKGKAYFHVSVKLDCMDHVPDKNKVVGIDLGIRNTAVTYDGKRTGFCKGTKLKEKRALYKETRQSLQRRNTPSSRRRLRAIGRRESRYVSNENHKLAKTLVAGYGPGTTFVLEDLSGVREATARVRRKDRYISVSWPYYDLQQKLEYKARIAGCAVIYVDPKHTSQRCPACGKVDKKSRDRERHEYRCHSCGYSSNDDRAAAMNIRQRGLEKMKQG